MLKRGRHECRVLEAYSAQRVNCRGEKPGSGRRQQKARRDSEWLCVDQGASLHNLQDMILLGKRREAVETCMERLLFADLVFRLFIVPK